MGQWLIADLSVSDVHFQLWMLLVAGVILFWFALRLGDPLTLAALAQSSYP